MGASELTQSTRWLRAVRPGAALALGTLFLVAWMWGLREVASVHAGRATLYVDWATGSDTTDCTSYAGPCATIGYALGQAGDGDTILVATGTYTENLVITKEGNISEDPHFVDPASGDYHLRWGSPAIDAGTNESAPETDFEGDRRPFDGDSDGSAVVDMGADEIVLPYNPGPIPAHRPDLDWDRGVDLTDIITVADVWGEERGRPNSRYRQYYDLRHNGWINIVDIMQVTAHWDETFDLGPHFPLDYSPYRPGQAPGGPIPSPLEIGEDMELIEQETKLIRTYGACDEELAAISGIANGHGIHVYQGVKLTSIPSSNDQEMACFTTLVAQHQNIVAGVIGNEILLSGSLAEPDLINYLDQAREMGNVPVTTGEPWGVWCNEAEVKPRCQGRPLIGEAVDFILAHSYPYWENVPIEHGAAHVVATYITLRGVYTDRVVAIGETGWPTCGDPRDNAAPSLENQRQFIEELWRWSNLYDIPVQYFEAFDEDWKVVNEGEVGRCWGLYHADRTPKHDNLDWSIPTPEPTPTTPSVRIEHPKDITTTVTKSNCGIPIFGRAYNAEAGWHVKVEVFTDQWYVQDKWYPDGLAPIIDGMWSMPEVMLGGEGGFNNHSIRATLVDETGTEMDRDEVTDIVRANPCSP